MLNQRLESRPWIMGDEYTIADHVHVRRALQAFMLRPAVFKGLTIPARTPS